MKASRELLCSRGGILGRKTLRASQRARSDLGLCNLCQILGTAIRTLLRTTRGFARAPERSRPACAWTTPREGELTYGEQATVLITPAGRLRSNAEVLGLCLENIALQNCLLTKKSFYAQEQPATIP